MKTHVNSKREFNLHFMGDLHAKKSAKTEKDAPKYCLLEEKCLEILWLRQPARRAGGDGKSRDT
jgi:hypothetical protein